ncbi:hypothetical protein, partial [Escherichia coli]|uniref:hypothetical protein n=1 Tax=Escherichia coli TaxID=562 RepID=UPI003F44BAD3
PEDLPRFVFVFAVLPFFVTVCCLFSVAPFKLALNWQFVKGVSTWFLQVMLMKVSVFSLGDGEAPFLDIVAYAGYTFPW